MSNRVIESYDRLLRKLLRDAFTDGADNADLAQVVAASLPHLCDRRAAHAHVEVAYEAKRELDAALPFDTGPFERPS